MGNLAFSTFNPALLSKSRVVWLPAKLRSSRKEEVRSSIIAGVAPAGLASSFGSTGISILAVTLTAGRGEVTGEGPEGVVL